MRRRTSQLPSCYVRLSDRAVLRLLAHAKARGVTLGKAVEEMAERGLCEMDQVSARAHALEAVWFVHLVETSPADLQPWQRAVLDLTLAEEGIWKMPPPATQSDGSQPATFMPRIDARQLHTRWPALVARAHAVAPATADSAGIE